LLFSNYAAQRASACVLLRFGEGRPHAWLRRILPWVSSGAGWERDESFRLNLAFTYRGLEQLRLPAATLQGFSREFQLGKAHADSWRACGEEPYSGPESWDFSDGEPGGVHAVLLVYATTATELEGKLDELTQGFGRFQLGFEVLRTYWPSGERESAVFDLRLREPNVRGLGSRRRAGSRVARGEFLLGYTDGVGDRVRGPVAPVRRTTRQPPPIAERLDSVDFGFNGSYLVVEKLEPQQAPAKAHGLSSERASLEAAARASLDTRGGDEGRSLRHQVLPRERPYAREDGAPGLLFLALNVDLARQFEHVQAELLSARRRRDQRAWPLQVRGGIYGFLPSLRALGYLADLDESRVVP
jgi:hypothetical protein